MHPRGDRWVADTPHYARPALWTPCPNGRGVRTSEGNIWVQIIGKAASVTATFSNFRDSVDALLAINSIWNVVRSLHTLGSYGTAVALCYLLGFNEWWQAGLALIVAWYANRKLSQASSRLEAEDRFKIDADANLETMIF